MDVKTLRAILAGAREKKARRDKTAIDAALLERVFSDCDGYVQRMHEILTEEHGVAIGYSTLSRLVRQHGLGVQRKDRACHVPDMPGEEMQHDTSLHKVRIGSVKRRVVSCSLYLRYSKMRYLRFYRVFNRFTMKCFIDEALRHWGYTARTCIIDNTNLAVWVGTGSSASMNPEMIAFAQNYGFCWKAHAVGHADRKAGCERNFHTIETNFFPGRRFASLEDMNQQAIQWATVRYAKRPQAKTKLIPLELFETEKSALVKLPAYINTPYLFHKRRIDEYGYVSFNGNFYWVPQTVSVTTVPVLQYAHQLRIMDGHKEVVRYELAADGVKNAMIVPPGHAGTPRHTPRNRKSGCEQEENRLRELGEPVGSYLDMVQLPQNGIRQPAAFIRRLHSLLRQWGQALFAQVLKRAGEYRVYNLATLERIAAQLVQIDAGDQPIDRDDTPHDYRNRAQYRDGEFSHENDIDYGQLT
jgi:hypothetical protein